MNQEDAMVQRAAEALGWAWDQDAATAARWALSAALEDLPTADGWCRWTDGTAVAIAYPATAVGRGEVEVVLNGAVEQLTAAEAETRGLMLIGAARQSRRLTHRSDDLIGEQR